MPQTPLLFKEGNVSANSFTATTIMLAADQREFQPHVPPHEEAPELTLRAVLLGAVLGILFGASSTYLALRVGLTVSASVPIAVIAIALLRPRGERFSSTTSRRPSVRRASPWRRHWCSPCRR